MNKTFCLVAVALAAAPAVTCAADDSFRLTVFGKNHDTPRVLLENTSTDAATIVDLQIALGDTSYDFDRTWAQSGAAHVKPTLLDPDHRNGLRRAQTLHYTFTGLGPGKHAGFTSELDRGAANNRVDYRHVLFDLGLANTDANALISVGFSDGKTLAGRIPDFTLTRADRYTFSLAEQLSPTTPAGSAGDSDVPPPAPQPPTPTDSTPSVPEPTCLSSMVLAGTLALRRRR